MTKPTWMETIRITLEPAQLEQAVVVFLFSNCSQKKGTRAQCAFGFPH